MFSEREKFTGNKNRTGREIPDRNGPEREAAEEAGKAVRGGNIGYIKNISKERTAICLLNISSVCTPKYTKKPTTLYRLLSFLAI